MKKVNNLFNAGYGWGRTYPQKTRQKISQKEESIDYSKEYMYIEALEDGMTVSFTNSSLYYSLDKQEWNELTGETPVVNSGEKVYFKGVDLVPNYGIGTFTINKQCIITGNIMSLLFGDNFVGKTDLTGYDYAFCYLFRDCTTIQSAENLILPATVLTNSCYANMFYGCTSLTSAPELNATNLVDWCYANMFWYCTNLTSVPVLLPATTLTNGCYNSMFRDCTSLTTAPELPATTLVKSCYGQMFENCTSLNYVKMLATDISEYSYLNNWVKNTSSTGTFVKADGVEIPTGTSGIPEGWTVETA